MLPFRGTGTFISGTKLLERDADYSPPSTTEVKSEWSYTTTTPIGLHGMDRDNFTFYSHTN